MFPHHENERAQSETAYGCTFANHWMHSGMLQMVNAETGVEEKMSKSLNNFLLLYEVLDQVRPAVLRMLMLQTHYRSPSCSARRASRRLRPRSSASRTR